jgi:hypothetical protein
MALFQIRPIGRVIISKPRINLGREKLASDTPEFP